MNVVDNSQLVAIVFLALSYSIGYLFTFVP